MLRRYVVETPGAKYLIYICQNIALIGMMVVLCWFLLFLFLHEWDLALSLIILSVALLPCWALATKVNFSAGLMLSQLVCLMFVIVFCLLYDVPIGTTQRTTHLYLLVIAFVGYMNFQTNRSPAQIIIVALSLVTFIIFCSNATTTTFSFYVPRPHPFQFLSIWLNPILSTLILCGALAAMHADLSRKTLKVKFIHAGLYKNEFTLLFQPIVDRSGLVLGAEALLRWEHPQVGTISPTDFIPEAQEAGLMPLIGEWVVSQGFKVLALWQADPLTRHMCLSVNITVDHLMQSDFVEEVLKKAKAAQVPPSLMKFEITESMFVSDPDTIVARMDALAKEGFRFSLDDFGTGFSSLSYLRRLPLEQIKIDRSFVSAATESKKGAIIAKAIAQMGSELNLEVLAEGIETSEQWSIMQRFGCTVFQGFLFSPPVTAKELNSFIFESNQLTHSHS